jgi:hypothetical protein
MGFRCAVSEDPEKTKKQKLQKYNYAQRNADMDQLQNHLERRKGRGGKPGGNIPDQELVQQILAEKGVEGLQVQYMCVFHRIRYTFFGS